MNEEFEFWWKLCWRKISKGAARKSFIRARKLADFVILCKAATAFKEKVKREGTAIQFQPHPSTWLNGERWLDEEPEAPQREHSHEAELAGKRCKLRLKGILIANFGRQDVEIALKANQISAEEARRLTH